MVEAREHWIHDLVEKQGREIERLQVRVEELENRKKEAHNDHKKD